MKTRIPDAQSIHFILSEPTPPLSWHNKEYVPYDPNNKEGNRSIFVKYGVEEIERILKAPEGVRAYAGLNGGAYSQATRHQDKDLALKVDGVVAYPDAYYADRDGIIAMLAYGFAKDAHKAAKNIAAVLYYLAAAPHPGDFRTLVVSAPYEALGEVRRAADLGIDGATRLLLGKSKACNAGDGERLERADKLLRDGIRISLVSEITNKKIPDLLGSVDEAVAAGLRPDTYIFNGERYQIRRGFVDIDDLCFDAENNRLQDSDGTRMTQDEAWSGLLDDANAMEASLTNAAINRRREIIAAGGIIEELIAYRHEVDGKVITEVTDGNNRLAHCRYIRRNAYPGSAEGYRYVRVAVFDELSRVDRELMEKIKNGKQKSTKVDHARVQDAFLIYRRIQDYLSRVENDRNVDVRVLISPVVDDLAEELSQYSVEEIVRFYKTVSYLKTAGWNDAEISAGFFSVAKMFRAEEEEKGDRKLVSSRYKPELPKNAKAGSYITRKDIVDRIHLEVHKYLGQEIENYRKSFLNGNGLDDTILAILRVKQGAYSSDERYSKILHDWLGGGEATSSIDKVREAIGEIEADRKANSAVKTKQEAFSIRVANAQKANESLQRFARGISGLDAEELAEGKITKADVASLQKRIQQARSSLDDVLVSIAILQRAFEGEKAAF